MEWVEAGESGLVVDEPGGNNPLTPFASPR